MCSHELQAPTESERLQMLISKTLDMPASVDVSLSAIATRSAALVSTDLVDLIHRSEVASAKRSLRRVPYVSKRCNVGTLLFVAVSAQAL
jgi:AAA+ superfamily predicted ATPase